MMPGDGDGHLRLAAGEGAAEFDCADCGRHIVSFGGPPGEDRCGICLTLPGWWLDPDIRRYFEPDPDWQPPAAGKA